MLHFASSDGGHLHLLSMARTALPDFQVTWVTQESQRARTLHRHGDRVELLPKYDRHMIRGRPAENLRRSFQLVRAARPRVVVTTGSGLVVPFCVLARASGAVVIFAETAARIHGPSQAGRVLSRLAESVFVQWEPMLGVYRGARLCLPTLFDEIKAEPAVPGEGTFVAVGTMNRPFDRLLRAVDDAAERGLLPQPVIAQVGVSTYEPRNFEARPWLSPDEMDEHLHSSRLIVSHGGTGMISSAFQCGRRPLVMPRTAGLEHFDGHQEEIASELGRLDLVVPLADGISESDVKAALRPLTPSGGGVGTPMVHEAVAAEVRRVLSR